MGKVSNPGQCPSCGSWNAEWVEATIDVDNYLSLAMECLECGTDWEELYKFMMLYVVEERE